MVLVQTWKAVILGIALSSLIDTRNLAWACSCPAGGPGFLIAPKNGQSDVPTDAKIWIQEPPVPNSQAHLPRTLTLLDSEGNLVTTQRSQLHQWGYTGPYPIVTIFSPTTALRSGMTYTIQLEDLRSATLDLRSTTFTVTASERLGADSFPSKPVAQLESVFVSDPDFNSSCGPAYYGSYQIPLNQAVLGVLDVAGHKDNLLFSGSGPSGIVDGMSLTGSFYVGKMACSHTWLGAAPRASTRVRFGLFDISGNFSGWSDAQTLSLPAPLNGGGCTGRSTTTTDAGVWFLPAVGLWRRRKKSLS